MFNFQRSGRAEQQRLAALADLEERQQLLRPAYKIWGYRNIFAKGFLLTQRPSSAVPRMNWMRDDFSGWSLQYDPQLPVAYSTGEAVSVAVLGHAFSEGKLRSREQVAAQVRDNAERGGQDAVDEFVTWLSGRYIVMVSYGTEIDVYNDPLASRACYWHEGKGEVVLASHTALISDHVGGLTSERKQWALSHPGYKSPKGRWMPGRITAHDEVGQIYANGRITVRGGQVDPGRFFPKEARTEITVDVAAAEFRAGMREQIRNWASAAPVLGLMLTAGRDSRAVLDAGLDLLRDKDAIAITYHPFHVPSKSTYDDLAEANALAAVARLPHLVIDVKKMSPKSQMAQLYNTTFPTYKRYANLAAALYTCAPARSAAMFGIGGGLITGIYSDTSETKLTPQLLAKKYAYSKFADDPELHDEFAAWMQQTEFSTLSLQGYSFYDFFHWEHRLSKWAAEGYSEYDLAMTPAPVFSSRRIILSALQLPPALRDQGAIYAALRSGAQ